VVLDHKHGRVGLHKSVILKISDQLVTGKVKRKHVTILNDRGLLLHYKFSEFLLIHTRCSGLSVNFSTIFTSGIYKSFKCTSLHTGTQIDRSSKLHQTFTLLWLSHLCSTRSTLLPPTHSRIILGLRLDLPSLLNTPILLHLHLTSPISPPHSRPLLLNPHLLPHRRLHKVL